MEKLATPVDTPRWVCFEEAVSNPAINGLIGSVRTLRYYMADKEFTRELVEGGALVKAGKSYRLSLTKAPAIIEGYFKQRSLEALKCTARGHHRGTRQERAAACA